MSVLGRVRREVHEGCAEGVYGGGRVQGVRKGCVCVGSMYRGRGVQGVCMDVHMLRRVVQKAPRVQGVCAPQLLTSVCVLAHGCERAGEERGVHS